MNRESPPQTVLQSLLRMTGSVDSLVSLALVSATLTLVEPSSDFSDSILGVLISENLQLLKWQVYHITDHIVSVCLS